ncbi:MAG: hypothetical protein WC586_01720 [Methanoregula sp.]
MGRSVESVRQGVNTIAARWARSARTSPGGVRQACGEKLTELAKSHASEAFYVCDDALEAALFSAFAEVVRHQAGRDREAGEPDVDP